MHTESIPPVNILWRRIDVPGHDAASLTSRLDGWLLKGAAVFLDASVPCYLHYSVNLDPTWCTRSVVVRGWCGAEVDVHINVAADRHWSLNGAHISAVDGCIDIDLAFTPATNIVPVRRLALPLGRSAEVVAAWLRFPQLDLKPLDQVYHRTAEHRYDYQSLRGTFSTALSVSSSGFVTDYPGLWVEERG